MTQNNFDCRRCGLCCVCFFDQDVFCDVTREDEKRLSKRFVEKHVKHPGALEMASIVVTGKRPEGGAIRTLWRTMKTGPLRGVDANVCAALRGSVMDHVSCSVYRNRPEVCRTALNPGDKECHEVRKMMWSMIRRCLDGD